MSAVQEAFNEPVAKLTFRHAATHEAVSKLICGGDQFDIGRREIQHYLAAHDMTISTHHLRLHCIVFESCEGQEYETSVPPLVYVEVLSSNPVTVYGLTTSPRSRVLRRSDPAYLLNTGDVMFLNDAVSISLHELRTSKAGDVLSDLQRLESQRFREHFRLSSRLLGRGSYGAVFLAVKASSGRQLACKLVCLSYRRPAEPTDSQKSDHLERLQREYEILQKLDHPNIIKVDKVIRTSNHIYLFKELILGGDLMSFVQTHGNLTETNALLVIRQVLLAVEYMHNKGVVHRDIKPENILLTSWRDGARIVLTDFGGANIDPTKSGPGSKIFRMRTVIGTPGYQAPEMFNRSPEHIGYTPAADIWSVGCLAVTILTGGTLYDQTEHDNLATQFNSEEITIIHARMLRDMATREPLSRVAIDFIKRCLILETHVRPTASQALRHPWFTNPIYATSIEDVYRRATANWTSRGGKVGSVYQFLDTSDIPEMSQYDEDAPPQNRSDHFANSRDRSPTPEERGRLKESAANAQMYSQELQ